MKLFQVLLMVCTLSGDPETGEGCFAFKAKELDRTEAACKARAETDGPELGEEVMAKIGEPVLVFGKCLVVNEI